MKRRAFTFVCGLLVVGAWLPAGEDAPSATTAISDEEIESLPGPDLAERVARLEAIVEADEKEDEAKDEAADAEDPNDFRLYWKNGIRFDTNDGQVKFKLGGRIQLDAAWFELDDELEDAFGTTGDDGVEFRRVRLNLQGSLYDHFELRTQYDFVGSGDGVFKDVYLGLTNLDYVGGVRIGHYKEPFSLEELNSSNDITFMERALPNTFSPSRNVGIMAHKNEMDERVLWAVGVFRDTDDFGMGVGDGYYNVTGRVSGLPILVEDDAGPYTLLHLGTAYSYRNPMDDELRFRQRPESHLAPRLVDTGTFGADEEHRVGVEAAFVMGPFSAQSEYIYEGVNAIGGLDDLGFHSFYVYGSYFLTGEHRPYKKSGGYFSRVDPINPLFGGGCGAWEVAARYSYLDLDSEQIDGGVLHDITGGLNWYWNYNYRMMFNYVWSKLEGSEDMHTVQMRFQVAF